MPVKRCVPGQIRNSNGPMLAAMAKEHGLAPPRQLSAVDRLEATLEALETAADSNIVVFSGGVSVGTYDFVPRAVEEVRRRDDFSQRESEAGQTDPLRPAGAAVDLRIARQSAIVPFRFSSLCIGGDPPDERARRARRCVSRRTDRADRNQRRSRQLSARPRGEPPPVRLAVGAGAAGRRELGGHFSELRRQIAIWNCRSGVAGL